VVRSLQKPSSELGAALRADAWVPFWQVEEYPRGVAEEGSMAHECPDCYVQCYCNGDIDDINFGEDPDSKHELAGWILYRHPDGQWVTLRKATDRDISTMSAAVSKQFHDGYKQHPSQQADGKEQS
jgi:hypothetical protein